MTKKKKFVKKKEKCDEMTVFRYARKTVFCVL